MSRTDEAAMVEDCGDLQQPLIIADNLKRHFPIRSDLLNRQTATVHAVDGVSFEVRKGKTLSIVGESGCGKSTIAQLLIGLIELDEGGIIFDGDKLGADIKLKELRRGVQMVFQDSYASLNPRLTIVESIAFGPRIQGIADPHGKARDLMRRVGLEPERFANRYPHELSGDQRQRVNIARALAMSPRFVILDEAISALDSPSRRRC